jgi:hypothetical protein
MSFFSKLRDKIFDMNDEDDAAVTADQTVSTNDEESGIQESPSSDSISVVDVAAQLENMAANHAEKLSWRTSIVDLLKLVDMDSSYSARKELAADVGIDGYEGSAENNIALHKAVLAKLAENGGTVPKDLL